MIMKLSTIILNSVAIFASVSAVAKPMEQPVETQRYEYGMHLDIEKVLKTEVANTPVCEVVDAKMTYLNSKGDIEVLTYTTQSSACSTS
jgi:hypothetical protein